MFLSHFIGDAVGAMQHGASQRNFDADQIRRFAKKNAIRSSWVRLFRGAIPRPAAREKRVEELRLPVRSNSAVLVRSLHVSLTCQRAFRLLVALGLRKVYTPE
jgi:ribosomal protein L30/L7E